VYADKHDIYFGTSVSAVDGGASPYVTNYDGNSWAPPALEFGRTHYWRVDEVNDSNTWEGMVWWFTTKFEILDPNLCVWYPFDELTGTIVTDYSGHSRDGVVDGPGDAWDPNGGMFDGCRIFDNDTHVKVSLQATSSITDGISILVWLNGAVGQSGDDMVVFDSDISSAAPHRLRAIVPDDGGDVIWRAGNDTNDVLVWDEATPSGWEGDWHHFAFVKDENAGTMTIYFNALPVDSKTGTISSLASAVLSTRLRIGAYGWHSSEYDGRMDDFRVYDYALPQSKIEQLFRGGDLGLAWRPRPYDGHPEAPWGPVLIWEPGDYADTHDVYFGTDRTAVEDANSTNHPGVDYNNVDVNTYDPGALELGQTYYWRVDEVNDSCDPNGWRGNLWRFAMAEYITIDDMEDYTGSWYGEGDHPLDEGWADYYANGTNATVTLQIDSPVRDEQSMEYAYDNAYLHSMGYCSEIQSLDLSPTDWTSSSVKMLMLSFYGWPDNDVDDTEQMYVGVEDGDGLYAELRYGDNEDEDMNDIKIEETLRQSPMM
jgi:hypothetical protein